MTPRLPHDAPARRGGPEPAAGVPTLADVESLCCELREMRAFRMHSDLWATVIRAEDMLLQLHQATAAQDVEMDLPDVEGTWWMIDEDEAGACWSLVFVNTSDEDGKLCWSFDPDAHLNDEGGLCGSSRWVRCLPPPAPAEGK